MTSSLTAKFGCCRSFLYTSCNPIFEAVVPLMHSPHSGSRPFRIIAEGNSRKHSKILLLADTLNNASSKQRDGNSYSKFFLTPAKGEGQVTENISSWSPATCETSLQRDFFRLRHSQRNIALWRENLNSLLERIRTLRDEIRTLKLLLSEEIGSSTQFRENSKSEPHKAVEEIDFDDDLLNCLNTQLFGVLQETTALLLENHSSILKEVPSFLCFLLDTKDAAILEIRPGVGGDEACLFAQQVLDMYKKYAEEQRWLFNILHSSSTDERGGCKEAIVEIKGDGVYGFLKHECGVHRVQRIPITDKSGRVHTSTATVVVFPKSDAPNGDIDLSELSVETMRSSGPGGQSVNKSETAVRVIHLPSKLSVVVRKTSSQAQNKQLAINIIRAKLLEQEMARLRQDEKNTRYSQIGSGDRSEKVRTYNFLQNTVVDHRCKNVVISASSLLESAEGLDKIISELQQRHEELILDVVIDYLLGENIAASS
ncbi:peptidyl-tRna hydrolase domain-containing protein [Cardiosporidium cionae]|uniref:Peptidyl-tRna hydrolase domain-containing protein n=1 Tax=Cardiosporidium cionae TaxID=476202 RepID=A0ABQ7JFL9_9APIC|nr:peptidyl-tRna hydrolase domain-containing protein [Cardiosporidium cionae]|eukprot:KAF8822827.1 peptidyl-tRna hydrolase domain-containing protein [Cardiosporidium cionae]